MKRIGTTICLLAGLSGCISVTATPTAGDRKPVDVKPTATTMATPTTPAASSVALPTNPTWTAHPGHDLAGTRQPVDQAAAWSPQASGSLTPMVTTPRPLPAGLASATPLPPAHATRPAPAAPTSDYQASYPSPTAAARPPADLALASATVPTAPAKPEPVIDRSAPAAMAAPSPEEIIQANLAENRKTTTLRPSAPVAPEPAAKEPVALPAKAARANAVPLVRLVNTKRITLNFEVKDVGPSGLSTVELWYTQDAREWKKYEAPTDAKAYVVEVDEEGMYGFTLVARSGIGLGKEPPAAGEQPQVWVIVDLTRPEVHLEDAVSATAGGSQQVSIRWKATDKNLSRNPITLSWADKEDGPWKVIVSNIENTGKYNWQVPSGTPRCFVRVDAVDMAGNVGQSPVSKPILLDSSLPTVSITNVQSAGQ